MMFQGKNDKKLYILMIAATIIIGAVFFVYLYSRPVNNYSFDIVAANPDIGRMEEDGYYFDSVHGEEITEEKQKIFLNIPMDVKAGSYTIRVGYRSNAGSTLSVTSNSNPWAVKCDQISLNHLPKELPGEFNMNYGLGYLPGFSNAQMYITRDVKDLDIYVVYCGFKEFYIQSVELIGDRTYVKTIWLAGMFLLILTELIILGFIKGFWKSEKGISVAIIVGITLLVSIPLTFKMGLLFDDGDFLYGKINGIIDGLRDGQFPVRIHPNTLKGYGYAVSYFYPELFIYPIALMRGIGYSLRFCVYMLFFCTNLATATISFVCVKRVIRIENKNNKGLIDNSIWISGVGAFLYVFNTYRIVDIYSSGAMGEAMAATFLPLVVTGLYVVIAENGSISWLVLGLLGLVNSHMLTCEMVAELGIILCIVCFKKIFRKECLKKLLTACGITALLSAYFIVPFIYMSLTDTYKVYSKNAYETSAEMLSLKDILSLSVSTVGKVNNGTFFNTRYSIGTSMLVLSIVIFIWTSVKRKKSSFEKICFLFGLISLWLTSALFPWKAIEDVGGIIRTVLCMVQFPCRYLVITATCFMFSITKGMEQLLNQNESLEEDANRPTDSSNISINAVKAVTALGCTLLLVQALYYFSTLKQTACFDQLIYDGIAFYKYNMVGMGEYEPVCFDNSELDYSIEELQLLCDENTIINPTGESGNLGLTIGPLSKSGTDSTILIINPTGEEQILYMPITYYKGYRVENVAKSEDGIEVIPELFETEYGTVGLKIPVGYYNGAHITYHESIICRISEIISAVTFIVLLIYIYMRRKSRMPN